MQRTSNLCHAPSARTLFRVGLRYHLAGEYRRAEAFFTEAIRADDEMARAWLFRGHALAARGWLDAAADDYEAALARAPGFGSAHEGLGNVHALREHPAEAAAEYRAALDAGRSHVALHYNHVVALLGAGDPAAARAALLGALDTHPESPDLQDLVRQIPPTEALAG